MWEAFCLSGLDCHHAGFLSVCFWLCFCFLKIISSCPPGASLDLCGGFADSFFDPFPSRGSVLVDKLMRKQDAAKLHFARSAVTLLGVDTTDSSVVHTQSAAHMS